MDVTAIKHPPVVRGPATLLRIASDERAWSR